MAEGKESKASKDAKAEKDAKPGKGSNGAPGGASKLAQFISSKKLDLRRILAASHELETLRPEDRVIKLKKRAGRAAEGDAQGPKETRKPRSGRPVTRRAMDAALGGGKISGPTKTRLLRAVNHILSQKKQDAVDLRALF